MMFNTVLRRTKEPGRLIFGLWTLLLVQPAAASEVVQLVQSGGVYMVPVGINGAITIPALLCVPMDGNLRTGHEWYLVLAG